MFFVAFASKMGNADSDFQDFTIRIGMIKPTTEGKTFHDDVAEVESDEEA